MELFFLHSVDIDFVDIYLIVDLGHIQHKVHDSSCCEILIYSCQQNMCKLIEQIYLNLSIVKFTQKCFTNYC